MRNLIATASTCGLLLMTGCSLLPLPTPADSNTVSIAGQTSGVALDDTCEPLGTLTARADCDCFDKMSYDLVRSAATENLHQQARVDYPESNLVEVSSLSLYMNWAVARGIAYRCPTISSH